MSGHYSERGWRPGTPNLAPLPLDEIRVAAAAQAAEWRRLLVPRTGCQRGRVWRSRQGTWNYEVRDQQGKVVLEDNTGNWRAMFDACFRDVYAVRRVIHAGHRFRRSYAELVDRAPDL